MTVQQWCHMSFKSAQITGNSSVIQQLVQDDNKENIKATQYWPLVRAPHKGPVIWKVFPYQNIIMYWPVPSFYSSKLIPY